ncbi:MAG: helix-turn-helix transcriptional regulator [Sphingomonadales bacterium]|nr:helix-turn-helix transcriptional regulator [Sphingomonadales bacterium]
MLTSRDETDLILPLYTGLSESPPLATFLERLRRRAQADYVTLFLRRGEHATQLYAGRDLRALARQTGTRELLALDKVHYDALRPGRVYAASEFSAHDPAYHAEQRAQMEQMGIADQRIVRLIAEPGLDAWLALARAVPCTASDSALLSSLSPYVTEAVRLLVRAESHEIERRLEAAALARTGTAWLLLDEEARVIAADPALPPLFPGLCPGHRLRDLATGADRALAAAAAAFAADPGAAPRALLLRDNPRIEALLAPPGPLPVVILQPPALLALVRLPLPTSPARAGYLAQLHALPRREAELAIALSDGLSIAEAADAMGLTLETARNYSKRLYAKLGVRGQAELVALVHSGSATLA